MFAWLRAGLPSGSLSIHSLISLLLWNKDTLAWSCKDKFMLCIHKNEKDLKSLHVALAKYLQGHSGVDMGNEKDKMVQAQPHNRQTDRCHTKGSTDGFYFSKSPCFPLAHDSLNQLQQRYQALGRATDLENYLAYPKLLLQKHVNQTEAWSWNQLNPKILSERLKKHVQAHVCT